MFTAGILIVSALTVWWLIDYYCRYGLKDLVHDVQLGKSVL